MEKEAKNDIKTARHPVMANYRLEFRESSHRYEMVSTVAGIDGEHREHLPSTTQFIGHYIPEFDSDAAAARVAAKRNVSVNEILQEWEGRKNYACDFGTRVHENQEWMMTGRKPPNQPEDERERAVMRSGWAAMKKLTEEGWEPKFAELMVFSPTYMLAGTVDAIFRRGRQWMILDWKTNNEIRRSNSFGTKFLPPLEWLDECEFAKYSLQLNLYKRMLFTEGYLDATGKATAAMMLCHLTPDGAKFYPVEESSNIAELLLDYRVKQWNLEDMPV